MTNLRHLAHLETHELIAIAHHADGLATALKFDDVLPGPMVEVIVDLAQAASDLLDDRLAAIPEPPVDDDDTLPVVIELEND